MRHTYHLSSLERVSGNLGYLWNISLNLFRKLLRADFQPEFEEFEDILERVSCEECKKIDNNLISIDQY